MAKVFPFKGIIYNKKKIKKLSAVMAPPYDIISSEDRDKYYAMHDFNVIRLILGKQFPDDNEINNKYIRAAKFFEGWLRHGILMQDLEPSIYAYEQRFRHKRKKFTRLGFIALLRLEDFDRGRIFPHEETFVKPKVDRLELMRICSANFDAVFSLYSDKKGVTSKILKNNIKRRPIIEVSDKESIRHRLWKIEKSGVIKRIIKEMMDKSIFIADGHHRYEAALKYRDEMRDKLSKFTGEESYNHVMMYFTPMESAGLVILPIHRMVSNLPLIKISKFKESLKQFFEIEVLPFTKRSEQKQRAKLFKKMELQRDFHVFGAYTKGENKYYFLKLKDGEAIKAEWKKLDVTILHELLIKEVLGVMEESEKYIAYTTDENKAIEYVRDGRYDIALFLNPIKVENIIEIASTGKRMPQKSTYFYPKLLTGLVMNKILLDEKIKI